MKNYIAKEFRAIIEAAHRVSEDIGQTVEKILADGMRNPLSPKEARGLLVKVVEAVRAGASKRNDQDSLTVLEKNIEELVEQIMLARPELTSVAASSGMASRAKLELQDLEDIEVRAVRPSPMFHGREIPVLEGFVKTRDIKISGRERAY